MEVLIGLMFKANYWNYLLRFQYHWQVCVHGMPLMSENKKEFAGIVESKAIHYVIEGDNF